MLERRGEPVERKSVSCQTTASFFGIKKVADFSFVIFIDLKVYIMFDAVKMFTLKLAVFNYTSYGQINEL